MLPINTKIKCIAQCKEDNTHWIDTIVGYTGTTHRYITKEGYYINKDLNLKGINMDKNLTYIIAICKVYKPFKNIKEDIKGNKMNNKEIEVIYYNREYNDYLHNQQLVMDLALLVSQLLSNNKDIKIIEVPSPPKESK